MKLSKEEILDMFDTWLAAWNFHDLKGVLEPMHEDIFFENWNGSNVLGKSRLRKAWAPWFFNHGDFRFVREDVFVDEDEQKLVFQWLLEWPSIEQGFQGLVESRRGVDVINFRDRKIVSKTSYSKTTLKIGGVPVTLQAMQLGLDKK